MVDGNKIIITFYFIYCVCANYKCCIMPSRGPDLENKVSCILYLVLQILENSGRYWETSIYQYLYQYCRYWKILVKYWYVQYW